MSFNLSFLFHLNHTVTKGILNPAHFFFARLSSEVFFRINKKRFVSHSTKPILIGPYGSSIKLFWALFLFVEKQTFKVQVLFLLYEDLRSDLELMYRYSMFSNWNNELTKTFLTSDCCQLEGD